MKVYQYSCICPICRVDFTAFLIDRLIPPQDEIAHDRKSLLCDQCERRFVNAVFRSFITAGVFPNGVPIDPVRLSALLRETHGSNKPVQAAADGTGEAARVLGEVSVLPNVPIAGASSAANLSGVPPHGATGGGAPALSAHDPA